MIMRTKKTVSSRFRSKTLASPGGLNKMRKVMMKMMEKRMKRTRKKRRNPRTKRN